MEGSFGGITPYATVRTFCLALALMAAAFFAPRGHAAADANPAASAFMRELGAESIKQLMDPSVPQAEREVRFRRLLDQHFDLPAISKFVLGRFWRSATAAQRIEFQQAFEDFLVYSYSARFSEYRGVAFQVTGAAIEENGIVVVHSVIRLSKVEEVPFDWRLRRTDTSFMIVDLIVEGISLTVTERSNFGSIIQNRGLEALIADLRAGSIELDGIDASK
jgi:phospholipid transport system substrate-binding protein